MNIATQVALQGSRLATQMACLNASQTAARAAVTAASVKGYRSSQSEVSRMKDAPWWIAGLAVFIVAVVMLGGDKKPTPVVPQPGPSPGPIVVPGELSSLVATLAAYPAQKAEMARFYADWKIAVERTDILKSTGQFRTAHNNSAKAFTASTGYAGAPPVGNIIDVYLSQAVTGKPDFPDIALDAATKAKLVAALDTLARSLGN